jgi:hypothetical protein
MDAVELKTMGTTICWELSKTSRDSLADDAQESFYKGFVYE